MRPNLIQRKSEFLPVLDDALARIDAIVSTDPTWGISQGIKVQLEFMRQTVADGRAPSEDEKERINIGVLAVRNLDADPLLTTWLCELDGAFREWEQMPD